MSDITIEAGIMNRAMQRVASLWRDLAWVVQRSPQPSNDFAEELVRFPRATVPLPWLSVIAAWMKRAGLVSCAHWPPLIPMAPP
jgi:hypothetical protein